MEKIERPKATWHCFIPFTKTRQVYKNDLERYELQFLDEVGKIRYRQKKAINETSAVLITLLTLLLTLVPFFATKLPSDLEFLKLGLAPGDVYSWADHLMTFAAPATVGTVLHKLPHAIPGKIGKIINIILKIIPVLILIIYLINREKDISRYKKQQKKTMKEK